MGKKTEKKSEEASQSTSDQANKAAPPPPATTEPSTKKPKTDHPSETKTNITGQSAQALSLTPELLLSFGRLDSDYHVHQLVVNIAWQTVMAEATFDQMEQLNSVDPPITKDAFVRIWRTILLKRCHKSNRKDDFDVQNYNTIEDRTTIQLHGHQQYLFNTWISNSIQRNSNLIQRKTERKNSISSFFLEILLLWIDWNCHWNKYWLLKELWCLASRRNIRCSIVFVSTILIVMQRFLLSISFAWAQIKTMTKANEFESK